MLGGYIQGYLKNRGNLDIVKMQPKPLFQSRKTLSTGPSSKNKVHLSNRVVAIKQLDVTSEGQLSAAGNFEYQDHFPKAPSKPTRLLLSQ